MAEIFANLAKVVVVAAVTEIAKEIVRQVNEN